MKWRAFLLSQKNHGAYSIDFYACQSNLKNWNASFKIILSFGTLLICLLANKNSVSCVVFVSMLYFTVQKIGLKLIEYLKLLFIPLTFLLMGTVAIAIEFSSHVIPDEINIPVFGFYLYVSRKNLYFAFHILLKSLGAVSAMYTMALSTPVSEMITVLGKLPVPKLMIELMNMIYRFIFLLIETHHHMKYSVQSRLGYCDFKTACFSFGQIAANLLLVSLKKANTYYDAMLSRCYQGELCFLEEKKQIKSIQILGLIFYWIFLMVLWAV